MPATTDTQEAQTGSTIANRQLRRAVDRCIGEGVTHHQVAEALTRMAEALISEIGEERAEYRVAPEGSDGIDAVPFARECPCGWVYSAEHRFCSRCGSELLSSIVPKAIPGKLQFDKRIGKGGAGVVYLALDLSLGRRVAVKTLPTLCSPHDIARLRREAQTLAAVSHRHLATVYGFEVYRSTPMIVMEYVDGGTLADRIPLPLDRAIEVMLPVTEAVGCLHAAGVVHRDVKPKNIAFTSSGELKLLDFGLARLEKEATMSGAAGQAVLGTPAYLSPEAHARQRANPSFDLWAIGVSFYEVLTGRRPFEGDSEAALSAAIRACRPVSVSRHLAECPRRLETFFSRTFSKDCCARPKDALRLALAINDLRNSN